MEYTAKEEKAVRELIDLVASGVEFVDASIKISMKFHVEADRLAELYDNF